MAREEMAGEKSAARVHLCEEVGRDDVRINMANEGKFAKTSSKLEALAIVYHKIKNP